ncbi:MAG: hypothetical protein QOD40_1617 [Alphaproteobacteria bacterium]|jgi:hypothetical protein|nr:hypothetical protein [Alphaproteobacteria bacterium]
MRRLIAVWVFCFLFASSSLDPETFLLDSNALSSLPNVVSSIEARFTDGMAVAERQEADQDAGSLKPKSQDRFESSLLNSTETDPSAAQLSESSPRKVSVAEMCDTVASAAQANNLPVGFLIRLIWQESGFDSSIVSRAGAQGVAQFMPRVAAEWGLRDPFDPLQALPASARLLRSLHEQFGNLGLAAAAYNAGSGRIQSWLSRRGKLPEETRSYVMNITGHAAEQWVKAAPHAVSFRIPRRAPCQEIAARSNDEAVPLPLPRLAPPAVVYASASASDGKPAAAVTKRVSLLVRTAAHNPPAPAPIIVASKAVGSKANGIKSNAMRITPVTLASGKRQQLILPVKLAAKSTPERPLRLAIMTEPKDKRASKVAAKAPANGRIQLAMATRSSRR